MTQVTPDVEQPIAKGVAYLLKQQSTDGGWHSRAYGQLKGGAALTTLILDTFSQLPVELGETRKPSVERGLDFLRAGFQKKNTVAAPDGSLDFPTYGSALFLTATERLEIEGDSVAGLKRTARNYLLKAQLLTHRGFAADHPAHGGWDFLGEGDAVGITTGTNVSVVAHVLEALNGDTTDEAIAARKAAHGWLTRCQQADGGFSFTPEPFSLNNKAEFIDEARAKPRSYGTATCDGVRGLLAIGLKPEETAVKGAITWLAKRPELEVVPGFEDLPAETDWRRGLRFYYYNSLARIIELLPPTEKTARGKELIRILLKEQRSDGRWENESDRMRENDPLIATALCLGTLSQLRR